MSLNTILLEEPSQSIDQTDLPSFCKERIVPLLERYDVVMVARGAVKRTLSPLTVPHDKIRDMASTAQFHEHTANTYLFPVGPVRTNTLFAEKDDIAFVVGQILQEPKWKTALNDIFRMEKTEIVSWVIQDIVDRLQQAFADSNDEHPDPQKPWTACETKVTRIAEGLSGIRTLCAGHELIGKPAAELFPFLREVQQRLEGKLREIPWADCDLGVMRKGLSHARDVQLRNAREASEGDLVLLYSVQ